MPRVTTVVVAQNGVGQRERIIPYTRQADMMPAIAYITPYAESAQFVDDAQTDTTLAKPGSAGREDPGKLGDVPIHRLYPRLQRRHPRSGRQCDEYPYATTTGSRGPLGVRSSADHTLDGDPVYVEIMP
jgi:hypothetical protein